MNRITWLKITVPVMLVCALFQAGSGVTMIYSDNETLMSIHKYNGPALVVLILVHLALNWSWIKMSYLKK
jgi:hypothetical protein